MQPARSEVRDGMRIDWDVPITMDDGVVLRADVFRPVADGRYPVILSYGPYAKGLAFQDGYPSAWQRMVAEHPDVAYGSSNLYQNWEVVDPEKWVPEGYACVRVDSRGAGRSPGLHRPLLAARDARLLRVHRVGGRAALVERQGRPERHLLLRHQPVARRVAAAAAPRRDVRLGRRGRLVSRHDAPRRHPLHVLGELVRHAGEDGAVRPGRARPAQPRHGSAGVRRRDAVRPRAAAEPLRFRRRDPRAPARRRVPQGALAASGTRSTVPFLLDRELGRAGPASARQLRRLRARRIEGQMAGSARHRALDALLHRLRTQAAAPLLRLLPQRTRERTGKAAARAAAGAPCRTSSSSGTRTNGRSRARSWTKLLSAARISSPRPPTRRAGR